MPRNRMIKADFWTNDILASISPLARLLFIGLWNFSADNGVQEYRPARFKGQIFPYEDIGIDGIIELVIELCRIGKVIVYKNEDGKSLLYITNFNDHQHINRPTPPPEDHVIPNENTVTFSEDSLRTHTIKINKVKESKVKAGQHDPREEAVVSYWNSKNLPYVQKLSSNRRKHLAARLKEGEFAARWEEVIDKIAVSKFCRGSGNTGWKATFDWLVKNDDNYLKVLEGKYDNPQEDVPWYSKIAVPPPKQGDGR